MSIAELKLELIRAIDRLPADRLKQLLKEVKGETPPPQQKPCFGAMKGTLIYMSPDFDEPLEDFKDYM